MPTRRAFILLEDGQEIEITDVLRVLYDGVVESLDWGSGWWDGEDAAAVGWIGLMFGWATGRKAARHAKDIQQFERFRTVLDMSIPIINGTDDIKNGS